VPERQTRAPGQQLQDTFSLGSAYYRRLRRAAELRFLCGAGGEFCSRALQVADMPLASSATEVPRSG